MSAIEKFKLYFINKINKIHSKNTGLPVFSADQKKNSSNTLPMRVSSGFKKDIRRI